MNEKYEPGMRLPEHATPPPEGQEEAHSLIENLSKEAAAESIRSWENTLGSILASYSNETKNEFEANIGSFIYNVEHYANPKRPGIDEGDIKFYESMQNLKQVVELCKKGHSIDKLGFLLDEVTIENQEVSQKLIRLFTKHYPAS